MLDNGAAAERDRHQKQRAAVIMVSLMNCGHNTVIRALNCKVSTVLHNNLVAQATSAMKHTLLQQQCGRCNKLQLQARCHTYGTVTTPLIVVAV
jgi:hypothetical protein